MNKNGMDEYLLEQNRGRRITDFYDIFENIGKGGFASVRRGVRKNDQMEVAIKIIEKKKIKDKQRVNDEVTIHIQLMHPSVVDCIECFESADYVYIVLEFCHNGELRRYLSDRNIKLREDEASYIMKQIVEGIIYLHSHNIIHRDLSLSNILLTKDMDVKIADFGLAVKLSKPDEKHFTVCGTVNYFSPEVAAHSSHGMETDVWSLGCLLYTMLTGAPPFDEKDYELIRNRVIEANYKMPLHLSEDAKDLIRKLLQKNPKQRIKLKDILKHSFITEKQHPQRILGKDLMRKISHDSGLGTTHSQSTSSICGSNSLIRARSLERLRHIETTASIPPVSSTFSSLCSKDLAPSSSSVLPSYPAGLTQSTSSKSLLKYTNNGSLSSFPESKSHSFCACGNEVKNKKRSNICSNVNCNEDFLNACGSKSLHTSCTSDNLKKSFSSHSLQCCGNHDVTCHSECTRTNINSYEDNSMALSSIEGKHNFFEHRNCADTTQKTVHSSLTYHDNHCSKNVSRNTSQSCHQLYEPLQSLHLSCGSEKHGNTSNSHCGTYPCKAQQMTGNAGDPFHTSDPSSENCNKIMGMKESCLVSGLKPLNSVRLKPNRQHAKNFVFTILETGEVCVEFLRKKGDRTMEVCRISGDGQKVMFYKPGGSHGVQLKDTPPDLPSCDDATLTYSYDSLPEKYWKKYMCAVRYVDTVKAVTPKVQYYSNKAFCQLMENTPDPCFKMTFYEGGTVTKVITGIRINDGKGNSVFLSDSRIADTLPESLKLLWNHYLQCYKHCSKLEATLTQLSRTFPDMVCFPILVGDKPCKIRSVLTSGKENATSVSTGNMSNLRTSISPSTVVSHTQDKNLQELNTDSIAVNFPDISSTKVLPTGEVKVCYNDNSCLIMHSSGHLKYINHLGQKIPVTNNEMPALLKKRLEDVPEVFKSIMKKQQKVAEDKPKCIR